MLKNVTSQETNTFDEVNIVLNNLIDNVNLIETKLCQIATANDDYNAKVDRYNESLEKTKKKGKK